MHTRCLPQCIAAILAAFAVWAVSPLPCRAREVTASIITVAPGNIIYELEGHSMLRLSSDDGMDVCINWGVFDYARPNFIYRFVKGETDYLAAAFPTSLALDEYRRKGRRVTQQTLNLDSASVARLMELVGINLLPANATYRYNYVKDNCATRCLEIVEEAQGSPYHLSHAIAPGTTFRSVMRDHHRNYPWYQFGIDLALGSGIDYPITARESAFAPLLLRELLATATADGGAPAVSTTTTLMPGPEEGIPDGPTPLFLTPLFVSIAVCLWGLGSLWITLRRGRLPRVLTSICFGALFVVSLLLTFLIFVSVHEATSPNWLYLWINPLCILPVILVWLKKCNARLKSGPELWLLCYHFVNFAALCALAVIGIAGVQGLNTAFYPLMLLDAAISAATIKVILRK